MSQFASLNLKFPTHLPDNRRVDDLTREFLIESQEGLDRMERCLTELEERPEDSSLLGEIFRSVHTIKGTTGFLGFSRLESLAHAGENLLGLLRDGKLLANAEIISALLALMDGLRAILRAIEDAGNEGEGTDHELIEKLHELQEPEPRSAADRHDSPQAPAVHEIAPGPEAAFPAQTADQSAARKPLPGATSAAESTLRVDVTLLNRMMNLMGELVLTRNQILQATSENAALTVLSRRLDMVTADLREAVMKARMQPVSHVFSKFPRMVRDLAQGLDKRIRLQMEGQETELDKSLLEAIKDPLTHAVRNSVDHGIELPELRRSAGKDPEGLLRLRAMQEGSHVIIEVIDDGGGLRIERIRDKAIERKLITPQKAAHLSEHELMQLIFLPGFSTASAVTNISGRGVGMDVVRTNVEKIGGKVEVDSHPGKGATLRLRIPLTLAIIPALIVRSAGQSFALPQGALSELVHLPPEQAKADIQWIENSPLYRLRGRLLPLVFLNQLLAIPGAAGESANDRYIAVLNADGRRYGLVVDGLNDPEEIVVKPLSAVLKSIGIFSGATVLGNGGLALILDPGALASRAGVSLSAIDDSRDVSIEADSAGKAEYLLVETGAVQAALPLECVLRIERIPRSRIESIDGTPVLQFDGVLLPIEDSSCILSASLSERGTPQDTPMTVVVCRDGGRHVGVAVTQVLDVASGEPLAEAGTNAVAAGVTLLKDRVTSVVNLGRIPPLPASAASFCELDYSAVAADALVNIAQMEWSEAPA